MHQRKTFIPKIKDCAVETQLNMSQTSQKMNRKRSRWRTCWRRLLPDHEHCSSFSTILWILLTVQVFSSGPAEAKDLNFNVTENLSSGTIVGSVSGVSELFFVTHQTTGVYEAFDIAELESSGTIITADALDREEIEQYNFTLISATLSSEKIFKVIVDVIDVNDNSPTFAQDEITLEISELSRAGSEFNLGSALDDDAPPLNVQGYRLVDPSDFFDVNTTELEDGNTRYAELVVLRQLDRETIPYHTVTIEAFDGGNPVPNTGRIVVNVSVSDSNDNAPIFTRSSYNVSMPESAIVGEDVLTVEATDPDAGVNGDVTYSIDREKSDPDSIFHIDEETGRIYLNKKLDSESATEHPLTILATDNGAQPQVGSALVVVYVEDVNDNEPTINVIFLGSNEGKVSEGAAIGDYVARISVSDPDIGDVESFNVTMTGGDGSFGLKTENNIVYLVRVEEQLNREEKASYDIVLFATDFGSPPRSASISFTIEVEDINDNPPIFAQDTYVVDISEDSYPGTFVIHLSAEDPDVGINSQFQFSLLPSEQSEWFTLNQESGLITTAAYLDHEVNPEPRLTVVAADFGTPTQSSSVTVVVRVGDTDDSAPNFELSAYHADVSEETENGTCFLQVRAVDPDFAGRVRQVTYSFADDDTRPDRIALEESTGQLCLVSKLDRETQASYFFRVKATDQSGLHDFAQVSVTVLDANDNRPTFHPVTYVRNVAVTSRAGDRVVHVTATDNDDSSEGGSSFGIVVYEIVTGNELKLFAFDNETGEISVAKPLTNHGSSMVQLRISATDGGGLSSERDAVVTISILDGGAGPQGGPVFDESEYAFAVMENAGDGDPVGTVFAASSDGADVSYHIGSDLPMSTWFSVNSESGAITVASELDREIFPTVQLEVVASVGSPPQYGTASLVIRIGDVNDNSPIFVPQAQSTFPPEGGVIDTVRVPYSTSTGAVLYRLRAYDADQDDNALVRYTLVDDAGYFTIDLNSGEFATKKSLPSQIRSYRAVVQASDHGNPPKSTTGVIVVEALSPDGACPTFSQQSYSVAIPEDTKLAKSFKTITAASDARVIYRLLPSVDAASFGVYPNGSIYAKSKLDREEKDTYDFQLVAEATHTTQFTLPCIATADVTISINDVNDNVPHFDQTEVRFFIEENAVADTIVGEVTAIDGDIGENSRVTYTFANANEFFEIDSANGVITTTQVLDRESIPTHLLNVQATDGGDTPLMSRLSVRVYVEDVNDNGPVFLTGSVSPLLAIVEERQPRGTFVALVQAVDGDIGSNGAISYSFASGGENKFEIDSESGRIKTAVELNSSDESFYTIQIKAEDGGSAPSSATTRLQVKVRSSTENPAMFGDYSYAFFVAEGSSEPGTVLGSFNTETSATRVARAVDSSVRLTNFYIIGGDDRDVFSVSETTGDLVALQTLNYETKPQYILQVTAENDQDSSDIYTFQAQINIEDANDFAPMFSAASYHLTVLENAAYNTKIWTFSAVDDDTGSNGDVTYSILNQSSSVGVSVAAGSQPFRIDPETGYLYTNADIDRETISEYNIIIKATDRSATAPRWTTVSAVITVRDMNDHAPRFVSQGTAFVMEDEPPGFPVAHVAAEDDDTGANAHVTYSLIRSWTDADGGGSSEEMFTLDADTGVIKLVKKLDFEVASQHFLNVSATDGASSDPLTTFQLFIINVVDVNDVAPQFVRYVYDVEVDENEDAGSLVTRVTANDGDSGENGRLTYELHDKTSSFEIDPDTGVILTTRSLDREIKNSFILTVYVHDGAFPALYDWCTVEVNIVDVNDNFPQFAGGTETSGELDLGEVEIPEYLEAPALIYSVIASDVDTGENGRIVYSIADESTDSHFSINSTSGELWMMQRLDREETSSYRLKLAVTDQGTPQKSNEALLRISVLDWNDNDPVFTQSSYQGEIGEALPPGQFVLTVHADDPDLGENGEITYSIDSDSTPTIRPEGLFSIDSETGVITTTATLDREKKSQHQLIVRAIDSAPYSPRKTTVTVTIDVLDVNDNAPIFTENLVVKNVSESAGVGTDIASLQAQDKDAGDNGTVFYRISGGNTAPYGGSWMGKFRVDNDGRVTTVSALTGAYTYYINVTASDNGSPPNSAEAVVIVNVVPFSVPNFSQVQFRKNIYRTDISELMLRGSTVTEVEASLYENGEEVEDPSGVSITYSFPSGNEENVFSIDLNGRITVKDPSLLDYETLPNIRLIVSAAAVTAGGTGAMYAYSTVYVNLLDENDNAPRFAQDRYVTEVWEQQDAGTYVLQVSAHDMDKEANGEVRYYIDSGNKDHSFLVDDVTGIVTTALTLDREIHKEYKLIVHAYDLGSPRKTGSCMLKITVVDINDHKPTLTVAGPLSVPEGIDIGTLITTVTANDPDSGSKISFELKDSSGNENDHFTIDRQSGQIYLAKSVDYEVIHQATISVCATDGQFSDEEDIVLRIEDENDNAPVFQMQSYQATLDELSPVNTSVIQVHADDADSNENGDVVYFLRETVPNKPLFHVDPVTGWISTTMSEAFNPQSSVYNLIILAEDHGDAPLNCTVSVRIQIEDVNDHAPAFSPESYEASVSEAAEKTTHVINVTATDADFSKENRYVYYEIISGNIGSVFRIATYTVSGGENTVGEITVDGDLDRENISSYMLTVRASDQGKQNKSSATRVLITIGDVNDNQPVFNQTSYVGSVSEDARQQPVLEVHAYDPDSSSDLMFKITAGNDDSAFDIGECVPSVTGCRLINAKILDYEVKSVYKLTVQVWDGRDTATSQSSAVPVTINVLDVNEYSPYFAIMFQNEKVTESVGADEALFSVSANDKDGGRYGILQYSIINNEDDEIDEGCLPVDQMFHVVRETGEVRSLRAFDYESCTAYAFSIRAENMNEPASSGRSARLAPKFATLRVKVEVQSLDEFPPVFSGSSGKHYKFSVPFEEDVGYVIGTVNATDEDAGKDGDIVYEIDVGDLDQEFEIDPATGEIRLSRKLESSRERILSITATSGGNVAQTFVSIDITGGPAIALEAQILAIVFGVIAGIAVLIVLILCWKHRRSKKAQGQPGRTSQQISRTDHEYYDELPPQLNKEEAPVPAPRVVINHNGKVMSRKSDIQINRSGSGRTNTTNGYVRHSVSTNGHAHVIENGSRTKSGKKTNGVMNGHAARIPPSNGHPVPYKRNHSTSSGRGSDPDDYDDDEDAIDREVDQINSSSDTTTNLNNNNDSATSSKPKIRRKLSGHGRNKKQVLDSGIQKDIDIASDISDGPNNIQSPSVESIHEFGGDEGAGEEPLDIQDIEEDLENDDLRGDLEAPRLPPGTKLSRGEEPPGVKSNASSSYKSYANGSEAQSDKNTNESVFSRRDRLTNWAPEFQPLANVFSEIARLKEGSAARGVGQNTFIMKDLSQPMVKNTTMSVQDTNMPPPLITSVADQRNDIVAPVPLGFTATRFRPPVRRNTGGIGLYPQSNPQYLRTSSNLPPSSYLPSYTNAPLVPGNGSRQYMAQGPVNPGQRRQPTYAAQGSQGLGVSSLNSSQQGLSVSSLPRTPISHESSFTSPAMSPNLSPSLSPLATRSPSVSPLTIGESHGYDSGSNRMSNTEPNTRGRPEDRKVNERMVRV